MSRAGSSTILFSVVIIALLIVGWTQREEYWITADKGWGYALGIIGGSMMLLLLLYPLRKHWKLARSWFKIYHWFKMHMFLGVLGPVFILFHSNFHLGSLNSNIALFSMLLVAGSGIIGRYAYQKIHRGLYGEQIQFSELQQEFEQSKSHFAQSELFDQALEKRLNNIEAYLTRRNFPLFEGVRCLNRIKSIQKVLFRQCRVRVQQLLGQKEKLNQFTIEAKNLRTGIQQLKRMANYAVYARVFSLWHIFHLPIFFMMIIAGVVHVFAVHMY